MRHALPHYRYSALPSSPMQGWYSMCPLPPTAAGWYSMRASPLQAGAACCMPPPTAGSYRMRPPHTGGSYCIALLLHRIHECGWLDTSDGIISRSICGT